VLGQFPQAPGDLHYDPARSDNNRYYYQDNGRITLGACPGDNQIKQGRFSKHAVTYAFPVAQCAIEKFAKKLLGDSEIEAILQRLDRLTQDEARMTVAQTLGVVYGLVGNIKVVMEGAECLHDCSQIFI
jgi:hypothetical protein